MTRIESSWTVERRRPEYGKPAPFAFLRAQDRYNELLVVRAIFRMSQVRSKVNGPFTVCNPSTRQGETATMNDKDSGGTGRPGARAADLSRKPDLAAHGRPVRRPSRW